jgi:hypothetical protein
VTAPIRRNATVAEDGAAKPPVEVVEGSLCSEEELRRAVTATAVTSGILCALAGLGLGYLLGLREGRE